MTLDTSNEPALYVHCLDGSVMTFVEHGSGLYVYQTTAAACNPRSSSDSISAYTMVSTVDCSCDDRLRPPMSHTSYTGRSDAQTRKLSSVLLRNCPVTPDDAHRALLIPDVATLKGKMTCGAAAPKAPTFEAVLLPPDCNTSLLRHPLR